MPTDVNLVAKVEQWLHSLWTDPASAEYFAESPQGSLSEHGLTVNDLGNVDLRAVAGKVSNSGDINVQTRHDIQQFAQSAPSPTLAPMHSVQEVSYVTKEIYHDNPHVTNVFNDNSTSIDQSQNLYNTGMVGGDISFDSHAANATGEGAIANTGQGGVTVASGDHSVAHSGPGDTNVANGDGSQVIDGNNYGQANTGDGAVQIDGPNNGPINTGYNSGVIANGPVDHTVVGDHNQTANIQGENDGVVNFGGGAHIDNTTLHNVGANGPIAVGGGDATNISGNTLSDGSSIAGGHSSSQGHSYEDNSSYTDNSSNTSTVWADHSNVNTAQDGSEAHGNQQFHEDNSVHLHPVVVVPEPIHHPMPGGEEGLIGG